MTASVAGPRTVERQRGQRQEERKVAEEEAREADERETLRRDREQDHERGDGVHAERRTQTPPRDPGEPACNDEQPEMGKVPERDALVVAGARREVEKIARTPSGGEDGVVSPARGPSGDASRFQSAWALVNAQGSPRVESR